MNLPKEDYDIVVAGGGIAGISAAVKASSMGARVLLIEQYGFFGGMSTAGMVSPFMKYSLGERPLVSGVFLELEEEMQKMNGMIDNGFYAASFRIASFSLLKKSGCLILPNCEICGLELDGREVKSLEVLSNGKAFRITGKIFIDTTGDAQMIYLAGLPFAKGDEDTGRLQAMTMFFRMANINMQEVTRYAKEHKENFFAWMDYNFDFKKIISVAGYFSQVKKAIQEGRLSSEVEYIFFTTLPEEGEASFNTTNILSLDGSSSFDLTKAEIKGRQQVSEITRLLKEEIPGFEEAFLLETAFQVGVRETRRAVGDYVYTGDDVRKGRKFKDAIARACYGIDIHGQKDEKSVMEHVSEGEYYEIPLRTLFVAGPDNLLSAGRCISSTREGHSALRIMPTSAATGEASGAVSALAVKKGIKPREVPYDDLKKAISYNLSVEESD